MAQTLNTSADKFDINNIFHPSMDRNLVLIAKADIAQQAHDLKTGNNNILKILVKSGQKVCLHKNDFA